MTRARFWPLITALCFFPGMLFGADAKTGIIKGTITIAGKPTADVVVSLEDVPQDGVKARIASIKTQKAVMDQRNMKFIPYVLPVLVGTTVDFPNNDTNWHNAFSKSATKDFDLGLYPPGQTRSSTFENAGVVRILCNVHPAMETFIVVKGHPFFAAPDARGNYRLDGVPLGKYRLQVWHLELGTTDVGVAIVRHGEVLGIDFDLKKK